MENLVVSNNLDKTFWKNKKVLLTGHSGFKGSWLTIWLNILGAKIYGISLKPITTPSLFYSAKVAKICNSIFCDIRNYENLDKYIKEINPDIIFHLAAQPLVKESYKLPINTFSTNIMGTANLLNICREIENLKNIIVITTDKVYKNKDWDYPYRETDELGGSDPYSSSKAATEIIINSFRESYFQEKNISLITARSGNVIGGGDWSEDRLIPDAIRAWESDQYLEIRRPSFIRPWQHVLEPLYGYLLIAQNSFNKNYLKNSYNFGPNTSELISVREIINLASQFYENPKISFKNDNLFHETNKLLLENTLAKKDLSYFPRWNIYKGVEETIKWYKSYYQAKDSLDLCIGNINNFMK